VARAPRGRHVSRLVTFAAIPIVATLGFSMVAAQGGGQAPGAKPGPGAAPEIEVLQVRQNFYMIAGAGSNIGVQVGDDGVVVVDAGSAASAPAVIAAIKRITAQPIRYVVDTTGDPDHVGGNEAISKAGQTLFTGGGGAGIAADFLGGAASILSAEKVLERMSAPTGKTAGYPAAAWPTETFHTPRKSMFLNGEGIEFLHQPAAHTDGDLFVFFRRSDVIMAGDILDITRFPVIDLARGGSVQGLIAALNRLVDMAISSVPIVSREAGTLVIPGHGRVCDQLEAAEYRDMVTIVRDRVRDLIVEGRTLDQVIAAAPARGYTRRYGSDKGPWTTNDFVRAVYQSLMQERKKS
jgi:glyoxylase-like metal-dependent hydrolase (beta-lactamase superfamily II)